ncbi:helix-turn-helix domain-containing protein [Vibrio japonicus]|uniref:AraC family transcriptional regulator n=1 Tax=Vibrio japonicus TaxID=1824638 RepID=A0ABY5LQ97_9VIBR|nr:AraC family transcriptional regulator [Vibrio japonicus]UUM33038.1 AraC family transcriptional regulator [Vibrio japonicus]
MLSIPIPFVVSLLLVLLAVNLYLRFDEQAKSSCSFLAACALTTAIVGLRWTLNWPIFHYIQPIMASVIPVFAWHFFTRATAHNRRFGVLHLMPPLLVALAVAIQTLWRAPIDELITLIYLCYGIALIRGSAQDELLINVSFSHWEGVKKAETVAGWMLLFSAMIDAAMSLDFALSNGKHSLYILTLGHMLLLPILSIAVVTVGLHTQQQPDTIPTETPERDEVKETVSNPGMSTEDAQVILTALNNLMVNKHTYLDPDLTLSKLSRKLTVPAKQISIAVNLLHGKNISKLINEYRIEHAKQLISNSDDSITQILLSSGFQTKSNFNREFSRVMGMTPSAYRKQNRSNTPGND